MFSEKILTVLISIVGVDEIWDAIWLGLKGYQLVSENISWNNIRNLVLRKTGIVGMHSQVNVSHSEILSQNECQALPFIQSYGLYTRLLLPASCELYMEPERDSHQSVNVDKRTRSYS